jgi:hypothetical protein
MLNFEDARNAKSCPTDQRPIATGLSLGASKTDFDTHLPDVTKKHAANAWLARVEEVNTLLGHV